MYIVYNRNYEKVREYKKLGDLQLDLGEDFKESKVDTLEFIRGSTVIRRNKLDSMLEEIVKVEKDSIFEHITTDIEKNEDETVELKTENKNLTEKLEESTSKYETVYRGLINVDSKIKEAVGKLNGKDIEIEKEIVEEVKKLPKEMPKARTVEEELIDEVIDEDIEEYIEGSMEETLEVDESEVKDEIDPETADVLRHIQQSRKNARKNRKERVNVSFVNIMESGKLPQIEELRGQKLVRVSELSKSLHLTESQISKLKKEVIEECGGTPSYQNPSVLSPEEAVWIIVSAKTKNDNYNNTTQRYEKTKANAKKLYKSWESQKTSIEMLLK